MQYQSRLSLSIILIYCRPDFPDTASETTTLSEPLTPKAIPKPNQPPTSAMEGPLKSSPGGPSTPMRNTSIDRAIHAISPKSPSSSPSQKASQPLPDITELIKTAGSPEAAIQYLLKDKQSQSQQNNQLWRLVDKQRAMILGLNKDLEAALKDKEKYRRKLKEFMANPAVLRAAGGQTSDHRSQLSIASEASRDEHASVPDSPVSENPKRSPAEVNMAPYPITPPADKPHQSPSAVQDILNPNRVMPKAEEHASGNYDHAAQERAEDQARKEKAEEQLREIPYNASLPPSRTLPTAPPPSVPPPQVPGSSSDQPKAMSEFPAPPKKGPPTPLLLDQKKKVTQTSPPAEDSDSDYDDVLEVNGVTHGDRGRRRTRQEDVKEREILSLTGASDHSPKEQDESDYEEDDVREHQPVQQTLTVARGLDFGLPPSLVSPGLPASPRPNTNFMKHSASPPASPMPAPPVDSRSTKPNQQVPPSAGIATSSTVSSIDSAQFGPPVTAAKRAVAGYHQHNNSNDSRTSPVERTRIFKGLMVDEFPDLLLPPNSLPNVDIRVASSRMKPSRASLLSLTQLEEDPVFTLAIVSRIDNGELWRVEKDSASLMKLDQRMKQCPAFTARIPDRSLFSGHSPAKLDARRLALDEYLSELQETSLDISTTLELCKYLSSNTLPPNADETGAAVKATKVANTQTVGPDGMPIRSGYLTKKGKNFGGWKMRFFVLDGPHLKYYETPGGPHLGTIKLQNAQIGKQSAEEHSPARNVGEDAEGQYRHAFLIGEPKKKNSNQLVKHVLCAESDRERDLWVDALLQWTEYRDDESATPKASAQDRQHVDTFKKPAAPRPQQQQVMESESLETHHEPIRDAEATQWVAQRPKTSSSAEHDSPVSVSTEPPTAPQQPILISGPKDAQIISDAASWGQKTGGLPVPEEKKQKKRSFFGFGSKAARSSSDGQDSVFGGSENGSVANSQATSTHIPGVFGISLADAARYHPPADANIPLPCVVYRCVQYLEARNAILEEGIFRLSGSNVVIRQIRDRFNTEGDIDLLKDENYYDIHAIASLLKLYLRELPSTILTRELHMAFLSVAELSTTEEKTHTLGNLAQQLPLVNLTLLQYLAAFLIKIINKQDINKMNVRNVGIVFSPTLNIPAPVFALFLQNFEAIFGINPADYEPLHLQPEGEPSSHYEDPRRFEAPGRPSTSSGSASPHRLHRLDRHEPARSTPTPPLGSHRAAYEPQPTMLAHSASAYMSAPTRASPAYETEYSLPPSITVQDMHRGGGSSHHRQGYDTHDHQSGGVPAYDQKY